VIDVFLNPQWDMRAATAFLRQTVAGTGERPQTVTTDKAAIYPPALAVVLPDTEYLAGKRDQ
jgi:transposase-like protein